MAFTDKNSTLVQIGGTSGHPIVDISSPLTRLNYFDGKFLRAPDLQSEQNALLTQVRLASQAGGGGLVHGFDCTLGAGDLIRISDGYGLDWSGRPLLLSSTIDVSVSELIAKSQGNSVATLTKIKSDSNSDFSDCVVSETPVDDDSVVSGAVFYLIVVNHIEAYCGEEDVYGKLCSEACISDTARSHIVEGVEIRALPISLELKSSKLPFDNRHLRSRAASALFENERQAISSLISGSGITSSTWCLGAEPLTGQGIAIGLIGRSGGQTLFLDAWAGRRERIDTPPQQYWAARMAMRSHRIYLAQIAQFQCQLRDCLSGPSNPDEPVRPGDPCADEKVLLNSTANDMTRLVEFYATVSSKLPDLLAEFNKIENVAALDLGSLRAKIDVLRNAGVAPPGDQILIDCGIVELPSAGYLPVAPSQQLSVNRQVRQLMGAGVDLRFCVVRQDYVQHALEEAQHMERICLVTGIDDPAQKQAVDILVPEGQIEDFSDVDKVPGLRAGMILSQMAMVIGWPKTKGIKGALNSKAAGVAEHLRQTFEVTLPKVYGAARKDVTASAASFYMAAKTQIAKLNDLKVDRVAPGLSDEVLRLIRESGDTLGAGIEAKLGLARESSASSGAQLAIWIDLTTSDDIFEAKQGDRLDVRARINVVARSAKNVQMLEQRSVIGRLTIEKVSSIEKGATEVLGRLQADGIWQTQYSADGDSDGRTEAVSINDAVVVRRSPASGLPAAVSIILPNPSFFAGLDNVALVFESRWISPTRQQIKGLVRITKPLKQNPTHGIRGLETEEHELFGIELTVDGDALTAGSDPHTASIGAIDAIAKALDNPQFVESATEALFPQPRVTPEILSVLAKYPWVLFHRRRDKRCEYDSPAEVLRLPRRYRIYVETVDADTATDELLAALEEDFDSVIDRRTLKPVGVIEYPSGSPALSTTHTDIRADWQVASPNDAEIQVGIIASQGDVLDDGLTLAQARLQSLTDVLAPVSQGTDDLALLTTSSVPPSLASGELSGVIVYFTRQVGTVCHEVFRLAVKNRDEIENRLNVFFENPGQVRLADVLVRLGGSKLSVEPRFIEATSEYFTELDERRLIASWGLSGGGPLSSVLSVVDTELDAAGSQTVEQTKAIAQSIGTTFNEVASRVLPGSALVACGRASILFVETECHQVYGRELCQKQRGVYGQSFV